MKSLENLPKRLLTAKAVCEALGLSRVHVYRLVRAGKFPQPIRLGARDLRWPEEEIIAFLNERRGADETH